MLGGRNRAATAGKRDRAGVCAANKAKTWAFAGRGKRPNFSPGIKALIGLRAG